MEEEKKVGVCVMCGASDVELNEEDKCSNCSGDQPKEDHSHDHSESEGDDQHAHGDSDEHKH